MHWIPTQLILYTIIIAIWYTTLLTYQSLTHHHILTRSALQ